jgi:sterol desaturase/sphingolipid hydroxylase (fatty acid hydroxylase superfamily)
LQYGLFFGLLASFILLERLFPRRQPKGNQGRRWGTNAALTLTAILILPLLPVSFITAAIEAEKAGVGLLNNPAINLPIAVTVTLTLLVRGFISFLTHYLNHRIPFLWRFHRVHHMDVELDVSSTVRFHPVEMPLSLVIGLPIIIAAGLNPWVLVLYELFDISCVLFSHSNVKIPNRINVYLRYLIVTPDLHKVHHSCIELETNSNYSAVFPIWDIVFGTFRTQTREPVESMPLGLNKVAQDKANSFWWLLVSPLISLTTSQRREPLLDG